MLTTKKVSHMTWMVVIAALLYVNFLLPNDALSVCLTLYCCGYLLTCQPQYVIPSTIFFSFFAKLFRFGNYLIWVFIVGSMFIRVLLIKEKGFWSLFLETIIYVFLHILCIVVTGNITSSGSYMPLFYGLFLSAACFFYRPQDKRQCLQHYMWGFFISSLLALMSEGTRLDTIMGYDHFITTSGQAVDRFSGLAFDCNFYGVLVLAALFLLLFENENLFGDKKKLLWYLALGATVVLGLLSYSKAFLITMIVLVLLACIKAPRNIKRMILRMIPVAGLAALIFRDTFGNILQNLLDRFTSAENVTELTTGRWKVWLYYIRNIFSNFSVLFFGVGMQISNLPAAHNLILEILSRFGMAGLLGNIFHLRFSARMLERTKTKEAKTRRRVLSTVLFVAFFSLSAYQFESLWILMFLAVITGQETSADQLESSEQVEVGPRGILRI